jgi:hypothetical protein
MMGKGRIRILVLATILAAAAQMVGCDRMRDAVEDIGKQMGRSWEKARRRIGTGTEVPRPTPTP